MLLWERGYGEGETDVSQVSEELYSFCLRTEKNRLAYGIFISIFFTRHELVRCNLLRLGGNLVFVR